MLPAMVGTSPRSSKVLALFGWRRLLAATAGCLVAFSLLSLIWQSELWGLAFRVACAAVAGLLAFGIFEHWPQRLPAWMARWALQVIAVALVIPIVNWLFYWHSTPSGAPPFWADRDRLGGFMVLTLFELVMAPWIALVALVRQKEVLVQTQALAFALERSQLQHSALQARMHLLQAQVEPHFLFNTLANVRALVDVGSPKAAPVLDRLIAYLRAAVPRLQQNATTVADELDLVRAYLDVMQMRMPDRLQFALHAEPDTLAVECPPISVLTLVENAVRHGIDPSEDGGRIDIDVRRHGDRICARVSDSGVGLGAQPGVGHGTGLSGLRERLRLRYGDRAELRIADREPQGVIADIWMPSA
jgi:hypothetical protein